MSVALHIWVSIHHFIVIFVAQVQNNDISRCFLNFFKILFFWIVRIGSRRGGGLNGKKWPKMTKKIVSLCISVTVPHMIVVFWYTCAKIWYLQHIFFHFLKILNFRVFQSSSINAKRKFWGVPHLLHMCVIFSVFLSNPFRNFIRNIMLLANWQDSYIHTYQMWFQMFLCL